MMSMIWLIQKEIREGSRRLAFFFLGVICASILIAIIGHESFSRSFVIGNFALPELLRQRLVTMTGAPLFILNLSAVSGMFCWGGALLIALYHLAQALNVEWLAGTQPFYKTLPVSDATYSCAKFLAHFGAYPVCAAIVAGAMSSIAGGMLVFSGKIELSAMLRLVGEIETMPFQVQIGFGNPETQTFFLLNACDLFLLLTGSCFVLGSLAKRRAFIYALCLAVGATIMINLLSASPGVIQQTLRSVALMPKATFWLGAVIWNACCVAAATYCYAKREG